MSNSDFEDKNIVILWLTDMKNNIEYKYFEKFANNFSKCNSKIFTTISIIINYIKKIKFINTYIIITDSEPLFSDFIYGFLSNIKDFYVIPKFIMYTRQKDNESNSSNNCFYNYGGKKSSFDYILLFIKKEQEITNYEISSFSDTLRVRSKFLKNREDEEIKLIFDPIEELNQMYLPLYYKTMVRIKDTDNFDKFTKSLYEEYKGDDDIEKLLSQIINLRNIPKELLCKYWLRAYTAKPFHYKMNDYLNRGLSGKYSLFIKLMYEGLRLKVLESQIVKVLYRGAHMTKKEIKKIIECLIKKQNNLSKGILFCRAFLSFSRKKGEAIKLL